MKNKTKIFMMISLIAALILTACANQATGTPAPASESVAASEGVIAEGRLEPVHAANLTFRAVGIVESVNVMIGDSVKRGDELARLSNASVAEAQFRAANLELVGAQQALDSLNRNGSANLAATWTAYMNAQEVRETAEREWEDLNVDSIEDRIEDARADVEDRNADLQDAKDEFGKYKDLDKDNSKRVTAEDALETAREDYNEAIRNLDEITRERDTVRAALDAALGTEAEAKYQYETSASGVNEDQLALATARLENAQAQVTAAQANLSNYVLTAPFDGVVAEVAVKAGEQVSPETRIVSVADTSAWVIETTDVTELEVVKLSVGQNVTFTADALPDVTMNGVVTEISGSSVLQGGDVIYTVRIAAHDVDPRLKWGMTVEVTFEPSE
ncbi:MAG: efflux RND transporter periplasmic adaptor subunit [Anaerolineae bacterium]|nr:efflux RND transporter periplasmic adaptor subunit [Anaerolineae bacterium]MBL8106180.1 efflux RND transporter periplasmic adaptor subunit [Anaerolineales bacterium]